jgi:hypothetical protein
MTFTVLSSRQNLIARDAMFHNMGLREANHGVPRMTSVSLLRVARKALEGLVAVAKQDAKQDMTSCHCRRDSQPVNFKGVYDSPVDVILNQSCDPPMILVNWRSRL